MATSLHWLDETFCQDSESILNFAQLWNTTTPTFNRCFRHTLPVWVPAGLLWSSAPYQVYALTRAIYGTRLTSRIPANRYNISRPLTVAVLLLVNLIRFALALRHPTATSVADVTSSMTNVFTFSLLFALFHLHRLSGQHTSALAWHYTFLCQLASLPEAYMIGLYFLNRPLYRSVEPDYRPADLILSGIHTAAITVLFVLTCFADEKAELVEEEDEEDDLEPNDIVESFASDRAILWQRSLSREEARNTQLSVCPEQRASFLSKFTYWWVSSLTRTGYKRKLELDDLWQLAPEEKANYVGAAFAKNWRSQRRPGVFWTLVKTFSGLYLYGSIFQFISICLSLVFPQLLKLFIEFISDANEPTWHGYFLGGLMFAVACLHSVCFVYFIRTALTVGMRIRNGLITAIYRKSLALSSASRQRSSTGQIKNLMAVDAHDFIPLLTDVDLIWSAPLQIGLTMYFLYLELGAAIFAGLGAMLVLMPVNWLVSKYETRIMTKLMETKDERINVTSETLSSIRVVKLYGWEVPFIDKIGAIRDREVGQLKQTAYLNAITSTMWSCVPFVVAFVSFLVYLLSSPDHVLTPAKAFASLSLFELLRYPLAAIPQMINQYVVSMVSIRRLNRFLNAPELGNYVTREPSFTGEDIVLQEASFTWGKAEAAVVDEDKDDEDDSSSSASSSTDSAAPPPVILKDISLRIKKGSLVAVVGQVGSGKSSLLSAILGDMELVEGSVNIAQSATVSYVAQQAWIQNATLRDNVCFGSEFDETRYQRVLQMCALGPDIAILPGGDLTEIGERGINLSGGQKQRVALARACYAATDIVLLDDSLSAVDSHVAKHLFTHVLSSSTGYLADKTRLLVTNNITVLPEVDLIVVLVKGQITEVGSYEELQRSGGNFAEFLKEHATARASGESKTEDEAGDIIEDVKGCQSIKSESRLIDDEETEEGSVKWSIYVRYFRSLSWLWFVLLLVGYIASQTVDVFIDVWLAVWSNDPVGAVANATSSNSLRNERLLVYGSLGLVHSILVFASWVALWKGTLRSSIQLHRSLLERIMHSPMSFFDTVPMGRIVNRFSKDIASIDDYIPWVIDGWLQCFLHVIAILVLIIVQLPVFILVVLPIFAIYYFIQKFYIATARQITRLESVTRSPIFSHFAESLTGVSTIRAFGHTARLMAESNKRIDANQRTFYPEIITNRWLALRLEFCGALVVLFAAIFSVLKRETFHQEPAFCALLMYYALNVTESLTWLVRDTSQMETAVVSVERVDEYCQLPMEAEWSRPVNRDPVLPADWPRGGAIRVENYSVRYRAGLEPVLKNINLDIKAGEKVGVVGRTGSGKSTLTLALFRILEADQGRILIDGVDISRIGLHELRSKLSIIPQDPVLFSGTIRSNLDPLGSHSEEQLWRTLEQCHLKAMVSGLPAGLEAPVAENGSNLSVGERQLVCLGRALLRGTRILVMDEATSAVDLDTDALIQETINAHFAQCTIITIAHRLHTVRQADRVLALEQGTVAEFDSPDALLARPESIFFSLAKDAGIV